MCDHRQLAGKIAQVGSHALPIEHAGINFISARFTEYIIDKATVLSLCNYIISGELVEQ